MTRKLQPCGTRAAYARHLYKGEEPCDACKAANVIRANSSPSGIGNYGHDMDLALEANPPVIHWAKNRHGIQVAIYINDPHAEREPAERKPRGLRDIDIEYLEEIS
jgi:hypothetical protein